jgi:hypothetical protein
MGEEVDHDLDLEEGLDKLAGAQEGMAGTLGSWDGVPLGCMHTDEVTTWSISVSDASNGVGQQLGEANTTCEVSVLPLDKGSSAW